VWPAAPINKTIAGLYTLREMKVRALNVRMLPLLVVTMLWCVASGVQAQDRELHWDALTVEAHLDAGGTLDIFERHTMVFTGEWNGGERVFNVRARQKLEFIGIERIDPNTGVAHSLRETSVPSNVDDFTWADRRTLRWRSRLPSDPPFAETQRIYVLHYRLSGILLKEDSQYRINHDFAFPNRPGSIERFTLNLDLDPVWQPIGDLRNPYNASLLEPGETFVLDVPLHYSGSIEPAAIEARRPPKIVVGALAIVGVFGLFVLAFFARERSMGRFAPVDPNGVDGGWIEANILIYPAEVVGAAWDGRIGTSEVVALIARLTAEGKLKSNLEGTNSMQLSLNVDRNKLNAYERALIDGLFFDQRTETSTKEVRQHYKRSGFSPVTVISPELDKHVKKVLPPGESRRRRWISVLLYVAGLLLLAWGTYSEPALSGASVGVSMVSLFLVAILQIPGWLFRSRIDWGKKAAALLLIPALVVCLGTAVFLWWYAVAGEVELPWATIGALTVLAVAISNASINGMKSRQSREAIALRKRLAIGRNFFLRELEKPIPNLRDRWYPWLLAFGLGRRVDVWSSHHASSWSSTSTSDHSTSRSSTSGSDAHTGSSPGWTGGGGFSGGGGASGAWAAAAAGMAMGVASPSSSSSSGSSSSSSSGSSSGGGGGGGW